MDTKELYTAFAKQNDLTLGKSKVLLQSLFEIISTELAIGNSVKINKFGTFEVRTRAARKGLNPRTKETIELPSKKFPAFKATKTLKDLVDDEK